MVKVGVVGGTGYTGVELLRLLAGHPEVALQCVTSRSEKGQQVSSLYPNLRGFVDIPFTEPSLESLSQCDVVFFATPNGVAMKLVPALLEAGVKVIDLAADFRLKDPALWQKWYGMEHACPELLEEAIYGLPEVNREAVKKARLVACPGCYPTAVQLGFLPLLANGLVDAQRLIADTKSGVSGAGRGAVVGSLLSEASENFKAYGVGGHRHLPEIQQGLEVETGKPVSLTFVPHLTPMIRGIHATLYGELARDVNKTEQELYDLYTDYYKNAPFVDILPPGTYPETRSVKGANTCRIAICRPQQGKQIVVLSVIDNLCKGAAGQAVQNMNLMLGFSENAGLDRPPLLP